MGKVQENQVELPSSETHQLMVHSDDAYFLAKQIHHKEKDRLHLLVDTKAIYVCKMLINLRTYDSVEISRMHGSMNIKLRTYVRVFSV
jgi:hypothetical protein